MTVESASHIDELVPANPVGSSSPVSELDNHIQLLKTVLQTDFPNITGPVTATQAELNQLDGVTLGSLAEANTVNDDDWSGADLAIANGGTGASSASAARVALGLEIGADVQAWDPNLDELSGLGSPSGADQFPVSDGANSWTVLNATQARTALGLGSLATKSTVNNGDWSGTDLAVTNGGTGSSSASGARTNLGIGSMAERAVTIQSGGSPSGGSNGDVFLIY